jgi:hypothetical protein
LRGVGCNVDDRPAARNRTCAGKCLNGAPPLSDGGCISCPRSAPL